MVLLSNVVVLCLMSIVVLTPNGYVLIEPILHWVSDMHLLASPYDCPFVIMQQLNNIPTDYIFFTFHIWEFY